LRFSTLLYILHKSLDLESFLVGIAFLI